MGSPAWQISKQRMYRSVSSLWSPLLERLPGLDLAGIDWVIVGGESGPQARPIEADWVREIRDQCSHEEVPFFFKQWGGRDKKAAGRLLDGRTWGEMPTLREVRVPSARERRAIREELLCLWANACAAT